MNWRFLSSKGSINRGEYALLGFVLFSVKCTIERYLSVSVFHRNWWDPFVYIVPGYAPDFSNLSSEDRSFYAALLAVALPFIYIGVTLTIKRLRSVPLPLWMVILFFVPFINLLFLLLLCIMPSKQVNCSEIPSPKLPFLVRVIPANQWGSAAFGVGITSVFGFALAALNILVIKQYGLALFFGIPFMSGFFSVLVYSYHDHRDLSRCLGVGLCSALVLGFLFLGLAFEGIICIAMAAPAAIAMGMLGGFIGYVVQKTVRPQTSPALFSLPLFIPLFAVIESTSIVAPGRYKVVSQIEVNASPATVWSNVVTFAELPPPNEWYFKTGLAYPKRARIEGSGVGAIRYCEFSTGSFTEPIEIWDEPKLLKFSVTSSPPPMEEWSPYGAISTPHLNHYFESEGGQFRLVDQGNGTTLLEGTTWYRHKIWPSWYWRAFSDWILKKIHYRVLSHIKSLSEASSHSHKLE